MTQLTLRCIPIFVRWVNTSNVESSRVQVLAVVNWRLLARHRDRDVLNNDVTAALWEHWLGLMDTGDGSLLTSGALQTRVPALGSYFLDVVPHMFFNVISSIVRFACRQC